MRDVLQYILPIKESRMSKPTSGTFSCYHATCFQQVYFGCITVLHASPVAPDPRFDCLFVNSERYQGRTTTYLH